MATNAFQEKLHKKHQERLENIEVRRRARLKEKEETNENSDAFLLSFNKEKRIIVTSLNNIKSSMARLELGTNFDFITEKIIMLQKFISDSATFLPSYDIRRAQEILSQLRNDVIQKREVLMPKKKFAFKSRQKIKSRDDTHEKTVVKEPIKENTFKLEKAQGFYDKTSETLTMTCDDVSNQDLSLQNLEDCIVYIYGNPSTVRVENVINSKIFCGPVSRSVFISNCLDVTFNIACQQLRIHTTLSSKFYIHVTSKAIIEDCEDVGFSYYTWMYNDLSKHYEQSGLNTEVNNWRDIDDFNWLKLTEASPHWYIIQNENTDND